MNKQNKNTLKIPHKLRSILSTLFGTAAVFLIITSISVVWLNRTLIDNATYVRTVAPLITKPAVQNLIADKLSNQLIDSGPVNDIAKTLLPNNTLNLSQDTLQLKTLVKPVIQSDIIGIINSSNFANLWMKTNKSAQAEFISQLDGNSPELTLSFHPAFIQIVNQLKSSQLGPIADHINISPTAGNLVIKANQTKKLRLYYRLFQLGTIAFVSVAVISFGLSVWIAVDHFRAARRILLNCGIMALFGAAVLVLPQYIAFNNNDPITQNAIKSILASVTQSLIITDLIAGVVFIGLSIGFRAFPKYINKV